MAKIAIDCDGVLANFIEGFVRVAHKVIPGRFPTDYVQRQWDFTEVITQAEEAKVWDAIKETRNFWYSLKPFIENVHALANFLATGFDNEVYIVTSRVPSNGMSVTLQTSAWLKMIGLSGNDFNYLGVIVVHDASKKAAIYKTLQFGYSIDDRGPTVMQCDTLANHRAYILDRPWNQDVKPKRRVSSVAEFLADISTHKGTENG